MFLNFEKRLSDLTTWEEPFLSGCKTGVTECTVTVTRDDEGQSDDTAAE